MPEFSKPLTLQDISETIASTLFLFQPDALCVSGLTAGKSPGIPLLSQLKGLGLDTAVFCNTGCTMENIKQILDIVDGVVVGTAFKADGKFSNPIDVKRVRNFVAAAR